MPELYLITGNDEAAIADRARKLLSQLAGENADEFSLDVLKEGADSAAEQVLNSLLESLQTPPFLGGRKTIGLLNFSAFDEEPAKSAKENALRPLAKGLRKLAHFIESEFPEDIALVLSGPGIDKRKRLYKICNDLGKVEELKKPELKSYRWREEVGGLIRQVAGEIGMRLDRAAIEYLIEVIGVDTGRIRMELEKVFCFAGERPGLEQVRQVCAGNRDAYFFAFTNALGDRKLNDAMEAMAQTMDHAKNADGECIRLIRQTANFLRRLLHAKIAMTVLNVKDGRSLAPAIGRMAQRQKEQLSGNEAVNLSEWQLRNLGDQAGNYAGHELRDALCLFSVADRNMVSSGLPRRLVLEMLVIQVISRRRAA